MAGTVVTTEVTHTSVKKVTFAWTSSAGGAADATTTAVFDGDVFCAVQIPNTGITQPTNAYDVTVTDADGHDVLGGLGANLSNAANTVKNKAAGDELVAVAGSKLTLAVTNAGAAKTGEVVLYIR